MADVESCLPDPMNINTTLYKAAVKGDIEPFRRCTQSLSHILTPIPTTILHINITSENVSTQFVEEILQICPSLLLQVSANGDTPLHFAAEFNRLCIVKVLIERVKAQHQESPTLEPERGIIATREMLRMVDNKGDTALHKAMRNRCLDVVRLLVEEDSDFPYSANNCGETPLYIAADCGFVDGVHLILRNGTSVAHEGPNGMTALHTVVRKFDDDSSTEASTLRDIASEILRRKKSLTREIDNNGWTPLHYAAYFGHLWLVLELLESDVSAAYIADTKRKMTPLHLAAGQGYVDVVREIISCCPDCCTFVDNKGWNALHFAMASLTFNETELSDLVDNPLLKNLMGQKDKNGNSPIHVYAAVSGPDIFAMIIRRVFYKNGLRNNQNASAFEPNPELEKEILELSKPFGPYPRGVIRVLYKIPEEGIKEYVEMKDTHLIVAALIATVTFTAAFTVPGGYKSEQGKDQGTAILHKNKAFQCFVTTNAMAFVFAVSAVFSYFILSAPRFQRTYYFLWYEWAGWMTSLAMGLMVLAFISGSYAVLAPSSGLAIVTGFIGLCAFISFFYVLYGMFIKQI